MSPTNLKITIDTSEVTALLKRITDDLANLQEPEFLARAVRFTVAECGPEIMETGGGS